jgi:hypothetical protein
MRRRACSNKLPARPHPRLTIILLGGGELVLVAAHAARHGTCTSRLYSAKRVPGLSKSRRRGGMASVSQSGHRRMHG